MKQKGQMILMLILIMTVALAIGLSIVQKSLVDVSTSSKVEQSSRAFSAAEAGIEKALQPDASKIEEFPLANNSTIKKVDDTKEAPPVQPVGTQQAALEYPPLAKEDVAQVWLAKYEDKDNPPPVFYDPKPPLPRTLNVYWGNSANDKAALEVTLVYNGTDLSSADPSDRSTKKYRSKKWYLDNDKAIRANGFTPVNCSGKNPVGTNTYECKTTLSFTDEQAAGLMLIRARLLYNTTSQPFAVQATGACGEPCSIPPQSRKITSTGASGETQRKVEVFQLYKVVPHYFDYAIFSAGEITK